MSLPDENIKTMTIALFGKTIAPENGEYMRQLFAELAQNQVEIVVYQPFAELVKTFVPACVNYSVFTSNADLNADLLFSIGGDGTILAAERVLAPLELPLCGVNLGRVGFACRAH